MITALLAAQFNAAAVVADAFDAVGEDAAGVEIMEVPSDHWFLTQGGKQRVARAARNAEGDEMIVIRKGLSDNEEQIVRHEVAHIVGWRRYGEKIREHGKEFGEICRQVVTKDPMTYCRRD